MKAITITMNAFGPYRDQQTVDFSFLGEESIFLITGPTGAGKTTIFDAMCFALYGRASGSDRDQDSMRSHFATPGEPTYVDYTFELRGKTYRIVRMPKQEKKKERGEGWKEEPARAELYLINGEEEQLIASKIKEVNEHVEDILGLDYEQFRKMIMIPQGEFRKLISENSKEREEILQRIFKTEFFAQLTDHFKKHAKELETEIKQFEWKIDQEKEKIHWGMEHDDSSENQELSKVQERLSKRIHLQEKLLEEENIHHQQLQYVTEQLQNRYYKEKQTIEMFDERDTLLEEKKQLDEKQYTMDLLQKEHTQAMYAAEVRPYEKQYEERKHQLHQWIISQQDKEKKQKQVEQEFREIEERYKQEEANENKRQKQKEEWNKKAEEQKRLDEYLGYEKQLKQAKHNADQSARTVKDRQEAKQQVAVRMKDLKEQTKDDRYLAEVEYEKKQIYENLKSRKSQLERLAKEWDKLKHMRNNYQVFMRKFKAVKEEYVTSKADYESALEEIRSHHAYTLSLQLEAGSPCPVCGSLEHPHPSGKPPHVRGEKQIEELKQRFEKADTDYQKLQEESVQVKSDGEAQRQLTESLLKDLDGYVNDLTDESIDQADDTCLKEMHMVKKDWDQIVQQRQSVQKALKQLETLEGEEAKLIEQIDAAQNTYHQHQQVVAKLEAQIESFQNHMEFSTTNPKQLQNEVLELEKAFKSAQKAWEDIQAQYQKKRDEWQRMVTTVTEGRKYIVEGEKALKDLKEAFDQTLVQFSFESIQSYKQALKSSGELEEITKTLHHHQKRLDIVTNRIQELEEKLKDQEKPDIKAVEAGWAEKKEELNRKLEQINEMSLSLRQNRTVQTKINTLVAEVGELAGRYYDIAELAQLSKGDNPLRLSLERYVLASFLDEILVQANVRLNQMTDHRYQLIRSDSVAKRGAQSGLDLEVIDHHTGLQRSVRTLSGGEGFKTSLSLALGMADVVQSHAGGVQLDTLFIDEGFGTLDEVSLEQAIDCLRGLQDGNRMLGIISHVPQLKEEIPAKLQIHAGPKGSSVEFVFQ
ncbi:AAA family ATPase [Halobacillus litoralis]|uniref:AAA family ATPase n=1 Tax=Halobacillus litoralis TaxID=45668 RepID=UPI001CFEEFB8|nr:SMC family ATPase [Halobacillus litoralis]